jgi:hypothetical protein
MTKKTLVLAVVAVFACCSTASAVTLPTGTAKKLAKRLAASQVSSRQLVSIHILKAKRVGAHEVKFAYDDRSAQNVFCTSVIVVKVSSSGRATATFDPRATACHGIPDDALAFETATRNAVRDVSAQSGAVKSSVKAFERSTAPCRRLAVPRNRRKQVALLTAAATSTATYGPIDAQVQSFVNAIGAIRTSDPTLVAGAAGWADLLQVVRSLPTFNPNLCGALKAWSRAHWAAGAAPADLAALKALDVRSVADEKAVVRAGVHLANEGVFPKTAIAFSPSGLLALAVRG